MFTACTLPLQSHVPFSAAPPVRFFGEEANKDTSNHGKATTLDPLGVGPFTPYIHGHFQHTALEG